VRHSRRNNPTPFETESVVLKGRLIFGGLASAAILAASVLGAGQALASRDHVVRAREVAATFREHVPQVAKRGLQALGMTSFRELHRLCVHESNPKLVAHIASRLEAPSDIVHSISARVGTLAAVSAFTLLDEALAAHRAGADPGRDAIVCALIGEAGNSVVAGHLALRYAQAQPRVAAA